MTVKNSGLDLNLDITYLDDRIKICGFFPAEVALQLLEFFGLGGVAGSGITGKCQLDFEWLLNDSRLDPKSTFTIDDLGVKDFKLGQVILKLRESTNEKLAATVDFLYNRDLKH